MVHKFNAQPPHFHWSVSRKCLSTLRALNVTGHLELLSSVHNNVLVSLMDLDLVEYAGWEHLRHVVPDIDSQILRGANRQEVTSLVWRNEPKKVMKTIMLHFYTCVKLEHICGLLCLFVCLGYSEARSGRRAPGTSAYSPSNGGKVWDIFIQVFVVKWIHNDFLSKEMD